MMQSAIKYLLDQAEEEGQVDVMTDFAAPLPLLVIAQMMGVPPGGPILHQGAGQQAACRRWRRT